MLEAARQSLSEGRYQEAIAAYQAVLKRDRKNVDAMTHLALIVAMGGHADAALETFDKALQDRSEVSARRSCTRARCSTRSSRTTPAPSRYGSASSPLTPPGEDRQRVAVLIEEARTKSKERRLARAERGRP